MNRPIITLTLAQVVVAVIIAASVVFVGTMAASSATTTVTGAACLTPWNSLTNVTIAPATPKACPSGHQPVTWQTVPSATPATATLTSTPSPTASATVTPPPVTATPLPPAPLICNNCLASGSPGDRLKGKSFVEAIIVYATLQANLEGSDFSRARIEHSNFFNANLRGASFAGAEMSEVVVFEQVDLTGANLTNVVATATFFRSSNLTNADLRGARIELLSNTWSNVVWNNTLCSDGTNSNANGGTCVGHIFAP